MNDKYGLPACISDIGLPSDAYLIEDIPRVADNDGRTWALESPTVPGVWNVTVQWQEDEESNGELES